MSYVNEGRKIFDLRGDFLDIGGEFGKAAYMDRFDEGKCTFLK